MYVKEGTHRISDDFRLHFREQLFIENHSDGSKRFSQKSKI